MKNLLVEPGSLKPNPWNTNVVSPDNEAKLDESIRRLGMFKPVLVRELDDGTLEILGGEHRVGSAQRLGMLTIPVINLGKVDDKKAKEIGLVDNGRYGADDALELAELMEELGTPEELASFLPYSDAEMTAIFESAKVTLDDLDAPPDDSGAAGSKPPKTHQIMRFKVPVDDAETIKAVIDRAMKDQGFTDSDSLTNAGDALVHLLKDRAS